MPIATVRLPNGKIADIRVPQGATPQQIESFVMSQPQFQEQAPQQPQQQEQSLLSQAGEAILDIPEGFGELAAGGFQKGAAALGRQDIAQRIGEQIEKEREGLTTAQKIGRGIGKGIATAPFVAPLGLAGGAAAGSAGLSVLEPREEEVTAGSVTRDLALDTTLGLATAGVLKGGSALIGKGLKSGASKIKNILSKGEAPQPETSATLKARSSDLFKRADEKGGILNQSFADDFILSAEKKLTPESNIGQRLDADSLPMKVLEKLRTLKNEKFDLAGIQDLDSFLGSKIEASTNIRGALNDEGRKLLSLQSELRGSLDKITPENVIGGKEGFKALKEAKKLWSKSLKLGDIERILARADLSDNPATAIKSGFRTLASNPKRLRGYTNKEVSLIKSAAKSGIISDSLRTLGSRLVPIGTAVSGGGIVGTVGGLGASAAARGLAGKSQVLRARKVTDEIISSALRTPKQQAALLQNESIKKAIDKLVLTGALSNKKESVKGKSRTQEGVKTPKIGSLEDEIRDAMIRNNPRKNFRPDEAEVKSLADFARRKGQTAQDFNNLN